MAVLRRFFPPVRTPWARRGRRILALLAVSTAIGAGNDPPPVDTQPSGQPLPPREAAGRIRVPAGFTVTLAAAEPDVRQPIAIAHDDRGRLWVAECYSYAGSSFVDDARDRILIFEDTDGDGVYDRRTVFQDGLNRLTGLVVGLGGVWICAAPHLSFIPDRNGDDRPDGPPVPHLEGWTFDAEHNSVNGLTWGPDGWLYGRHGIKRASLIGRPGSAPKDRTEVSCAIWRYHPFDHRFEVVADGTINPWGLDFDDYGQAFMSTSVIDHLWHVVPGARFERWKGRGGHPDPHTYELMTATSDHLHWGGGAWDEGGRERSGNDALGGGHSHCDALIYLGDRWPADYRGSVLMSNIHGRRINRDALVRASPDGRYQGVHRPDFLTVADPWFRAVSLEYGPEGDVVMTDWSDTGECHDRDGVHRSSGRIYRISYGSPRRVSVDLRAASLSELVALQFHPNDWFVRRARVVLQERAASGVPLGDLHVLLKEHLRNQPTTPKKLRALWALHVTGGTSTDGLRTLLGDPDEHLRHWAIRLLGDGPFDSATHAALVRLAATESSWLVQLALASALQRLPVEQRWTLAQPLIEACSPATDPNLIRLLWYGLEPAVPLQPDAIAQSVAKGSATRLKRLVARRLAEALSTSSTAGEALFHLLDRPASPPALTDLLAAVQEGLAGQRHLNAPARATAFLAGFAQDPHEPLRRVASRLAVRFGDPSALTRVRSELNDRSLDPAQRAQALETLLEAPPSWLADDLLAVVSSDTWVEPAIRALANLNDVRTPPALIAQYPKLSPAARTAVIDSLVTRATSARALLDAIGTQRIPRQALAPHQARQIVQLRDEDLRRHLERAWGSLGTSSSETEATLRRLRARLTPVVLQEADLAQGAALFEQRCAICHQLFGRGQTIGPDLTGSGRKDLDYVLINVVDPNASIPADYRLGVVTLKDERVLSGILVSETDQVVTIRTLTSTDTVNRSQVKDVQRLPMSLMPAGLLEGMDDKAVRDLVGYLMSDGPRTP